MRALGVPASGGAGAEGRDGGLTLFLLLLRVLMLFFASAMCARGLSTSTPQGGPCREARGRGFSGVLLGHLGQSPHLLPWPPLHLVGVWGSLQAVSIFR